MKFDDYQADSLYAGILDNPDDTLRRLILADRLDEIGRCELAEFIRVQCEIQQLLRTTTNNQLPRALTDREAALMENSPRWFPGGVEWSNVPEWVEYPNSFGDGPEVWGLLSGGFPAEIRGPMRYFTGGECQRCSGRGWVARATYYDGTHSDATCPACSGTGRTPAHGYDLIRRWPVTKVVVTGAEPMPSVAGDRQGPCIWWDRSNQGGSNLHPASDLPPAVFALLTGGEELTSGSRLYAARDLATAALSAAIITVARRHPVLLN